KATESNGTVGKPSNRRLVPELLGSPFTRTLRHGSHQKIMLFNVRKFINVEMIRDGGSFALKFENHDGNQYTLFTKIRLANRGPVKKDNMAFTRKWSWWDTMRPSSLTATRQAATGYR